MRTDHLPSDGAGRSHEFPGTGCEPYYVPVGAEVTLFEAAWRRGLPVMLKGPTGCGKTRLVEYMAARLSLPLFTVSCHEDMTASDLIGRYVLTGGETTWVDGPLTRAAREGGICYLDEVVEARQDAVVAIHSLADHRRELSIDRLGGERVIAAAGFQIVISYNPGYQSVLKDLKMSTRQRTIGIELDFPPGDVEQKIIMSEADVDNREADQLVRVAHGIRRVDDDGMREVCSTRTLVAAARLIGEGVPRRTAMLSAMVGPLTDDRELGAGLAAVVDTFLDDGGR